MGKKKKFKGESKLKGRDAATGIRSDKITVSNSLAGAYESSAISLNPIVDLKKEAIPLVSNGRDGRRMVLPPHVSPPVIPGISKLLTPGQVDSLLKGEYVTSGDFEKGLNLAKQDPIFFAVRGEPDGTVIANSKGSVLLPGIHIRLGAKFDYRT